MAPSTPAPNTSDLSPAEGDTLVQGLKAARAAEAAPADNTEIAADDAGGTAMAEQINRTAPPAAEDSRS